MGASAPQPGRRLLGPTLAAGIPALLLLGYAAVPGLVFPLGSLRWAASLLAALALLGGAAATARRRSTADAIVTGPPAAPAEPPRVALPEPPPVREIAAETLAQVRSAEQALAARQQTYALMTNLARRNQSLIGRQLSTLDELESGERDPDVLAGLFALDHLATRMRRNAENLLVLAGASVGGRGVHQPVAVEELLRGAAAEVEQYDRVDVDAGAPAAVAGHVVSDIAHLLAELLDNALACSPPDTRVTVGATPAPGGGLRLWVADEGIGMTAARLAEHNTLLTAVEDPPELGATLGFPVVRRLAARHRITVTLGGRSGGRGGLTAYVDVPAAVVVGLAAVSVDLPRPPVAALPGRRAARRRLPPAPTLGQVPDLVAAVGAWDRDEPAPADPPGGGPAGRALPQRTARGPQTYQPGPVPAPRGPAPAGPVLQPPDPTLARSLLLAYRDGLARARTGEQALGTDRHDPDLHRDDPESETA